MNTAALIQAAAKLPPARARQVLALAAKAERSTAEEAPLQEARAAFEKDMQPVCGAIVSALREGDVDALRGLRALLPHLLAEVNAEPALAGVLAQQLGKSLLTGLNAGPEELL